jgi:hypothetical protein
MQTQTAKASHEFLRPVGARQMVRRLLELAATAAAFSFVVFMLASGLIS